VNKKEHYEYIKSLKDLGINVTPEQYNAHCCQRKLNELINKKFGKLKERLAETIKNNNLAELENLYKEFDLLLYESTYPKLGS